MAPEDSSNDTFRPIIYESDKKRKKKKLCDEYKEALNEARNYI